MGSYDQELNSFRIEKLCDLIDQEMDESAFQTTGLSGVVKSCGAGKIKIIIIKFI